jgi:hypothetical protein
MGLTLCLRGFRIRVEANTNVTGSLPRAAGCSSRRRCRRRFLRRRGARCVRASSWCGRQFEVARTYRDGAHAPCGRAEGMWRGHLGVGDAVRAGVCAPAGRMLLRAVAQTSRSCADGGAMRARQFVVWAPARRGAHVPGWRARILKRLPAATAPPRSRQPHENPHNASRVDHLQPAAPPPDLGPAPANPRIPRAPLPNRDQSPLSSANCER